MKTRFVLLPVIISSLLFNSCIKHTTENSLPYYQFTADDKTKLLVGYNTGDVLVYKNQENDEMRFAIVSSVSGKTLYATGTFWGNDVESYFYYDQQSIVMEYAPGYEWSNCEITLKRYPAGSNYNLQYPVVGTPAFVGYIAFPLWNSYSDSISLDNSIHIDFNARTTSMTINGKTYAKVRIIQSGTTQVLDPNSTFPKNVNTLYYDQNAGIVGFDDVNGKMWRLQ